MSTGRGAHLARDALPSFRPATIREKTDGSALPEPVPTQRGARKRNPFRLITKVIPMNLHVFSTPDFPTGAGK